MSRPSRCPGPDPAVRSVLAWRLDQALAQSRGDPAAYARTLAVHGRDCLHPPVWLLSLGGDLAECMACGAEVPAASSRPPCLGCAGEGLLGFRPLAAQRAGDEPITEVRGVGRSPRVCPGCLGGGGEIP